MRHNENSQADVKNFIKEHSGTLVGFIFHYQGLTIQMHRKEKDIYEYFKEYKHTKEDWCVKEDSCRDFPFGANDDVVQGPKELGLKIAEELGNNMVHFQVLGQKFETKDFEVAKKHVSVAHGPKRRCASSIAREIDKHNSKVNKLMIRSGRRQMKGPMVDNA
ncbi:unnamed protein product [Sphagnum jensenii]|uniref:Uncharacterized protein n=1 Tax=Sphagnum jensenii TaxID=128206 RepID=A0ABP0X0R4_9BRYO